MNPIHPAFKRNLAARFVGRLKLAAFRKMTGSDDLVPSASQIRAYLVEAYRASALWGRIVARILNANLVNVLQPSRLNQSSNIQALINHLEGRPRMRPFFLETDEAIAGRDSGEIGLLVHRESLDNQGHVYLITLLEEGVLDAIAGQVQVYVHPSTRDLRFTVFARGTREEFNRSTFRRSPEALLAVRALECVRRVVVEESVQLIDLRNPEALERCSVDDSNGPPIDQRFEELLHLAFRNRVPCTRMTVPMALIRTNSAKYCFSIPLERIERFKDDIGSGRRLEPLVYWDGRSFVVCDDHVTYLAYRALGRQRLSVVIMGDYPRALGRPTKVGASELIPPGGALLRTDPIDACESDPELFEYLVDRRLVSPDEPMPPLTLYRHLFELIDLLRHPNVRERHLHEFILRAPVVLDPSAARVSSEVRFGSDYRADLVLEYGRDDRRVLFVELERADLPIFTQDLQLRAYVTHALQQVENWIRWWREHPHEIPAGLDRSVPLNGMVVMGRSSTLPDEAKRTLLHLNSTRDVKLVTYDDLLERLLRTIQTMEAGAGS